MKNTELPTVNGGVADIPMHRDCKLLIVCSKNSGKIAPFIVEQAESVRGLGHQVEYFTIQGKGISGYLKNFIPFMEKLRQFRPDVVHAHYGLSCLFANLQRKVPVVSTYHGSDINDRKVYRFSKIAIRLSKRNVFVSERTMKMTTPKLPDLSPSPSPQGEENRKNVLIPCGVDTGLFVPMDKQEARQKLGLEPEKKYVLFSGAFTNRVKNPELAKAAVTTLPEVELLELKGYSREEVVWLMNAVDAVLMTSYTEGSPQFIKEAMACNCPVVSVDVGDVAEVILGVDGCSLAGYDANELATELQKITAKGKRTEGRERILALKLDLMDVAQRIELEYYNMLNCKK